MKLYNFPIKTFDPSRLMDEIIEAKDGDVFVVDEKNVSPTLGGYESELTIIQVKKVRDEKTPEYASPIPPSLPQELSNSERE